MLTSGTGRDECNTHVWIWHQTHNRSGKVSSYSQIYSHSTSAENTCLGRAGERSHAMQVKETKGRRTNFGLGLRVCSGLCSSHPLRGECTCRSYDLTGLGRVCSSLEGPVTPEGAQQSTSCVTPVSGWLCALPLQATGCCWSGCACPVLQSLSHRFPFLMAQSRASLVKLQVRSVHWNGCVRVVSDCLKWCSRQLCLFRNMLCYGRVWKTNGVKLRSSKLSWKYVFRVRLGDQTQIIFPSLCLTAFRCYSSFIFCLCYRGCWFRS